MVLAGMNEGENFEGFTRRIIQQFKKAGILKEDGSSNLRNDGSFILPPKITTPASGGENQS